MNGTLTLVRHGESKWNAKNVWTGLTDIDLTKQGEDEARKVGNELKSTPFTHAFTSKLIRAIHTLEIILDTLSLREIPIVKDASLNERDYGIYTGKNKSEVKSMLGDEGFLALRRGWDAEVPEGENLQSVYKRVVPYFKEHIAPLVSGGQHVLLVAHGNSLRALIKYVEQISDHDIEKVELKTGEIVIYSLDEQGHVVGKQQKQVSPV